MNRLFLSLFLGLLSLSFVAAPADAKRLGGGGSAGMKRQAPPPAQPTPPTQQATPAQQAARQPAAPVANAGAAAAAPKRSWLGPVAGLAAGLGLAALASHLGFGEGLANFMTIALLAVLAVVVLRFVMRRFAGNGGARLAGAGAPAGGVAAPAWRTAEPTPAPAAAGGSAAWQPLAAAPVPAPTGGVPAGFDAPAFERIAKLIFIRMQAANDAGNLDDLRQFSTPEMFATFRLDLQERGAARQQTDVVQLDAQVLEAVQEGDQQIVSVRFSGLIREVIDGPAEPFDEVWHLAKPADGSREWAIAGIAQTA